MSNYVAWSVRLSAIRSKRDGMHEGNKMHGENRFHEGQNFVKCRILMRGMKCMKTQD